MLLIGDKHPVRIARKAKGWRLQDLADSASCSVPMLSMVENGLVPKPATRRRISDALDTAQDVLWPGLED